VTTVKGTEVILGSFQDHLKNILGRELEPGEEGNRPIANLLFQFMQDVTGYLDVAVVHIDKFRHDSGSPHSAKMPSSSSTPKVVSILGTVGTTRYYSDKGELCEPHQTGSSRLYGTCPRVRVVPHSKISEELALALIETMIKGLEFFAYSGCVPVPEQCNGFVIKYLIRSVQGSEKKWKFAFVGKTENVQDYKEATAAFSFRHKGIEGQKRLQRIEQMFIYVGQWVSIEKSLSSEASPLDSKMLGVTPTDLVVSEHATA